MKFISFVYSDELVGGHEKNYLVNIEKIVFVSKTTNQKGEDVGAVIHLDNGKEIKVNNTFKNVREILYIIEQNRYASLY